LWALHRVAGRRSQVVGLTWVERRREAPLCGKAVLIVDCSMFVCNAHAASKILRSTANGIVKPFSV
jgi:hypothetical protein